MKDFMDGLDERLRVLAADEQTYDEPAAAPAAKARVRRRFRRPAILGSATAALGVIAATFAMNGTSLADLPILGTPTTDASRAAKGNQAARKAGVDFRKAHAFGTPQGPGYVLLTPERDTICISIPEPGIPGAYGGQCKRSIAAVERDGLAIEFAGDLGTDPEATSLFAFVLPDGASDVRVRDEDGHTRVPSLEAGVFADEIRRPVTLTWSVDGRPARRTFQGPFPATSTAMFTCSDGGTVSVKSSEIQMDGTAVDRDWLRGLCRRR